MCSYLNMTDLGINATVGVKTNTSGEYIVPDRLEAGLFWKANDVSQPLLSGNTLSQSRSSEVA